jgi:3-hydroxypropanoate dehydrogenase
VSAAEDTARKASRALDGRALDTIFIEARSIGSFIPQPVSHELLDRAVRLALLGPTASNSLPMRLVFVESAAGKELLRPALSPRNVDKTMVAPVTAIVAADLRFYEHYDRTFPDRATEYRARFESMDSAGRRAFAWDNALLQMGYFMIAVRALGLDAGPMGGFERPIVDQAFFPDGRFVSNI